MVGILISLSDDDARDSCGCTCGLRVMNYVRVTLVVNNVDDNDFLTNETARQTNNSIIQFCESWFATEVTMAVRHYF